MRRFAFLLGDAPEGGTRRVFETLAEGLDARGWQGDLIGDQCLGPGWERLPEAEQARGLREFLGSYDAVIGNVFIGARLMNILRYLPARLPRVMIVHNVTYATYQAASALRDHVHHTIAVSPRIRADLLGRYGFAPERTSVILNGVPDAFFSIPIRRFRSGPRRLLSLGRLEERAKRITLIPEMVAGLPRGSYALTIAGEGPDRTRLEANLVRHGVAAELPGLVPRERLPEIYGAHDIFLFPSRYEGMGIALAEAMAAGLVPVASRIAGVTDLLIEDGVNGLLFAQGDMGAARRHLARLVEDDDFLSRMRRSGRTRAEELFRVSAMQDRYARILDQTTVHPAPVRELSIEGWALPASMGPGLRSLVPAALRRRIADLVFHR